MTETTTPQVNTSNQEESRHTENTNRSENTENNQQQRSKGTVYTDKFFSGQTTTIGGVLAPARRNTRTKTSNIRQI